MRIVSLCPSNTEVACALGLGPQLVGLDRSSDYPPEVQALPRVGPDLTIDVDAVAALRPDLVLSSLSVPGMERNLERLDAAGIDHIVLDADSIDAVYGSIRALGARTGTDAHAEDVVREMRRRLDDAAARADAHFGAGPRPRVFLEWWPKPVIVPGRRCWTTDMIRLAGGRALFDDLDVRSTPIPDDDVPTRAPDLLLTCWCGVPHEKQTPHKLAGRPGWDAIPAVRSGAVYAARECWFGRPGPRIADGVEWLQERLFALSPAP